jgi:hypothetical protein
MEIVLLKLILAHLLGDFFLQPNSWVKEKEERKWKSGKLYLHIALHIALIFLVFLSFSVWKLALGIGLLHGIIDVVKLIFQRPKTKRIWFFTDQVLHFAIILIAWFSYTESSINLSILQDQRFWLYLLGALFLTSPAAVLIKVTIAKWIPQDQGTGQITASLQDAGKFIGILERLLIYLFICTHHFEAVGFLLAAKSIFRFGDLREAHDLKLTEYVLIGTLLSFGVALITALGVVSVCS